MSNHDGGLLPCKIPTAIGMYLLFTFDCSQALKMSSRPAASKYSLDRNVSPKSRKTIFPVGLFLLSSSTIKFWEWGESYTIPVNAANSARARANGLL
ncbi:hypothetical protein D3C72_2031180 [compost metagenome]